MLNVRIQSACQFDSVADGHVTPQPACPLLLTHPPEQVEWVEGVISTDAGHKHKALHTSTLGSSNQVEGALVLHSGTG